MQSYDEIRSEAWRLLWKRNWFWMLLGTTVLLQFCSQFVMNAVAMALSALEVFDLASAIKYLEENNALPTLTASQVWQLATSGAIFLFFAFILGGISSYGNAVMLVRAADDRPDGWLPAAFDGFRRPLELAWMSFLMALVFLVWSALGALLAAALVCAVPGAIPAHKPVLTFSDVALVMAGAGAGVLVFAAVLGVPFYRYRYAFRLKADHPDWSALRCIRGSHELTRGFKWRVFKLDCSYWLTLLSVLLPLTIALAFWIAIEAVLDYVQDQVATAIVVSGVMALMASYLVILVTGTIANNYIGVGQTILYREIARERQAQPPDAA